MKLPILTLALWTACVVGTLILVLSLALAIGQVVPSPFALSIRELLLFVALAMIIVGLFVAYRWERTGGSLIVGGLDFFIIVNHGVPFNLVLGPMFVVGLMDLRWGGEGREWADRNRLCLSVV